MKDYYETTDLGLAAALVASGHKLVDVNKIQPRRAVFIFAVSEDIENDVDSYWSNTLLVSALEYFEATKRVKTRLYS